MEIGDAQKPAPEKVTDETSAPADGVSPADPATEKSPTAPAERSFLETAQHLLRQTPMQIALLILAAVCFVFWPLLRTLPDLWLNMDSYYAHGLLIPVCAAWIIWDRWDKIKAIPVQGSLWALLALLPTLWVTMIASRRVMPLVLSVLFVATLFLCVWLVAGRKWMWALAPALGFLILGLPILDRVIDKTTLPLQMISTDVAVTILNWTGFQPFRDDPVIVHLPNYSMHVAAACSGLKTTIAISAAVIFFMLIARLRWWANLILASIAIPLSITINGIRIAMIGMVGNAQGEKAALTFHDYSGYIALVLCFVILGYTTKALGYKG